MKTAMAWGLAALISVLTPTVNAGWTEFSLPNLTQAYSGTSLGHLSDGRYVYAETGNLYLQDSFGLSSYSVFDNEPGGIDPSFFSLYNDTTAVLGAGGFGDSPYYTFNPSSTGTGFSDIGITNQNYAGVHHHAGGILVAGGNGGSHLSGKSNNVTFISTDGLTNITVIESYSTFSAAITRDSSGNLYVADNDDGSVYRFTPQQIDGAITGTPLSILDGSLVHHFGSGGNLGSMAVDGDGNLWAAGWIQNGLSVYNPALDQQFNHTPSLDNANYKVSTFTLDGSNYVAYTTQANPGSDNSAQYYGYDISSPYAVPEPSSLILLMAGCCILLRLRSSRRTLR